MKEQLFKLVCSVCQRNNVVPSVEKSDWLEISVESEMLDRCWTEHHICPLCRKLIADAEQRKAGRVT